MSIHTLTLHRDPKNFSPFTDEFWPERWLIAHGSIDLPSSIQKTEFVHNTAAFIPFSYGASLWLENGGKILMYPFCAGPANCVGKPLAILGAIHPVTTRLNYTH